MILQVFHIKIYLFSSVQSAACQGVASEKDRTAGRSAGW